jgi:KDO2-lipid IV(A) lauroyltransferase
MSEEMNQNVPPQAATSRADSMKLSRRLRYYLETAGFFAVIGFFRLFGIDTASAIGGWIGRNLITPTPLSRLATKNLKSAFPDKSPAEIAVIVRAMWDNLGRVMAEYAHLDKLHMDGPDPRIEILGLDRLEAAIGRGKGVLLVSGHFANWEIMPFGARDLGVTGGVVVRPANNPYVNRWLERARIRNGMAEQIPKGAPGTRRIFSLLRKGEAALLLVDQRASEGITIPFFGRDAFTTPAPAALALKLGAVVVPASNERVGGARFRMTVHAPIEPPNTGDPARDLVEFTAAMTRFIEERVRERPHEWLWIHKRWTRDDAPLGKRAQALSPLRGGDNNATSNRV